MKAHCTTLDSRALGLAAGTIAASLTALCALFLAIAPDVTRRMLGLLVHTDLSGLATSMTWSGVGLGIICWGVGAGLVFAATAGLYNRLSGAARAERRSVAAQHFA